MNKVEKTCKEFITTKGVKFKVTYFTIYGKPSKRTLTVIAGQHGMEHSGPNLLPEFIDELKEKEFSGTVHICPCANPLALEIDYEIYPEDEDISKIDDYYYSRFRHSYCPWNLGRLDTKSFYNMNRTWGNPNATGTIAKVSQWLWENICQNADVIVDMHCLQAQKPMLYNEFEKNNPLCKFMDIKTTVMHSSPTNDYFKGNIMYHGSINKNQHTICLEFSAQHALKESEYELGKQSIRNLMAGMDMTDDEIILKNNLWLITTNCHYERLTVSHKGHIRYHFELYDEVKKGDKIFTLRDIQTCEILEVGIAPSDGIVYNIEHSPVIKEGMTPCYIAVAEKFAKANEKLEKLPKDFFNN